MLNTAATPRSVKSSRRGSQSSSLLSKSRSNISTASENLGPNIDGNLRIMGALDCGETVLSIEHTEDNSLLGELGFSR